VDIERYFKTEIYGAARYYDPIPMLTMYDIDNSRDGLLDASLPRGTIRLFGRNRADRFVFLGEDRIDNLAVDEAVRLNLGSSFNMQMRGIIDVLSRKNGDYQVAQAAFDFFNATDEKARVKVIAKDVKLRGEVIETESHKREVDEIEPTWWVDVPPESKASFNFGVGTEILYSLDLDPLSELTRSNYLSVSKDLVMQGQFVLKGSKSPVQTIGFETTSYEAQDLSAVTIISAVTEETRDDSFITTATITHAIKNTGKNAKAFAISPRYEDMFEGDIKVRESSIAASRAGEPKWELSDRDFTNFIAFLNFLRLKNCIANHNFGQNRVCNALYGRV